ncbi:hypothetical protein ACHAXA_000886 [Cyclostephanos tholiformis]|uniref:Methyltransferase-like protein 5 n=1 Tax=Cyclostephanos tholiformis TaxID=382380 RepID=A0ABD3R6F4_9STRA
MKLKHLESCLSSLPNRVFPSPKIELEQYPTSVHLSSSVVLSALERGDAGPGTSILDLGCGTGMLGLGFASVQSDMVYLVDCDSEALELARENVDMLVEEDVIGRSTANEGGAPGCLGVELIMAKVKHVPPKKRNNEGGGGRGHRGGRGGRGASGKKGKHGGIFSASSTSQDDSLYVDPRENVDDGIPLNSKIVDTVITNPPFGTKNNEGIDVQFLKTAIRLARRAVYSFHKTSTRPFIIKLIRERWGLNAEVVAKMRFEIPNMYTFHRHKSVDVEVDLIRIFWAKEEGSCEKIDGVAAEKDNCNAQEHIRDEREYEGEESPLDLSGHT